MKRFHRLTWPLVSAVLLALAVVELASQSTPQSVNTGQHFLPPYGSARDRFGFDSGGLSGYDVAQLGAGWYSNWGANLNPAHPDHLVYVQLIRFHAGADPHDPDQVTVHPSRETIAQIVAAHPGSLWLMSNEPDSLYQGDPILPEVYALVYHDFYTYIKGLDPTALIANGGIVQPTPCRLEYLDIVWEAYLDTYGAPMPVDVWNIHAFVLREVYNSWGASTPPGVDPNCGMNYSVDDGGDVEIFWDNIRAMRTWMKDKGQRDKPLMVSEYGILWPEWFAPQFNPQRVSHFMTQTFELFLYGTDPDIGYPADGDRLVQTWAWYSLSDDQQYNGYLFHSSSKAISPMGQAYADYTAALSDALYTDLSARLVTAWSSATLAQTGTGSAGLTSVTVSLTGSVANLGVQPATDVLARLEIVSGQGGSAVLGHDAFYTVPPRFEGIAALLPLTATLVAPERHELRLSLDPEGQVDEPREWNNVVTATLDLRPDLAPLGLTYRLGGHAVQSGALTSTVLLRNQGAWPSEAVSATVHLEASPEGTLDLPRVLAVPALNAGDQFSAGASLSWPAPDRDLYHLVLELDPADDLVEQDEENNSYRLAVPVVLSATLTPDAETVLTSTSGALCMVFPSGAVTTPTQIVYTPLWPADWNTGLLDRSTVAFSLAALLEGQRVPLVFARPVSLTWRYGDAEVAGLDEQNLRLFVLADDDRWNHAACLSRRRDLDQNQLQTGLCQVGLFVFGNRYDSYLPLLSGGGETQLLHEALPPPSDRRWPRSPLRLP